MVLVGSCAVEAAPGIGTANRRFRGYGTSWRNRLSPAAVAVLETPFFFSGSNTFIARSAVSSRERSTASICSLVEPTRTRSSLGAEEILNGFAAKGTMSSGAVEGLNNTLKLVTRKSYGFRTFPVARLAPFHTLGNLPEPEGTHRFC
jgi:hypothetical protein